MRRERGELAPELPDDRGFVLPSAVLEDVLYDIVTVLIPDELHCRVQDTCNDRCRLLRCTVLEDALNDATAVWMDGELFDMCNKGADDERGVFRGD